MSLGDFPPDISPPPFPPCHFPLTFPPLYPFPLDISPLSLFPPGKNVGIHEYTTFLANCRKGACGYVQCWKSSVLSSFLNIEKVILGSFLLEGRQFQAAGPAWKNPRGSIVLVEVAGTNRSPDAADLRCERPGSEATGMQYWDRYRSALSCRHL